jgi:hypothetical protein
VISCHLTTQDVSVQLMVVVAVQRAYLVDIKVLMVDDEDFMY